MAVDPDERRIRLAFRALRAADERTAPPFERILARGAATRPRTWPAKAAVALAAAMVVAAWGVVLSSHDWAATDASVPSLDEWSSPTAFLLNPVDEHVVTAPVVVRESIVDTLLEGQGR